MLLPEILKLLVGGGSGIGDVGWRWGVEAGSGGAGAADLGAGDALEALIKRETCWVVHSRLGEAATWSDRVGGRSEPIADSSISKGLLDRVTRDTKG